MNRLRMMVLGSVVTLAGLAFGTTSSRAQMVGPTPRYYTPGYTSVPAGGYYYGGYYYAPQPAPGYYYGGGYYAPAPSYRAPARRASAYDPSGRHDGLARPWLRPLR